jgi:chromodomain-helicase-DNA-binding protein 1
MNAQYDSESDLSDVAAPPAAEASLSTPPSANQQSDFGHQDAESTRSSSPEADPSDDGDFDMDEEVSAGPATNAKDRSTSIESRRPPKRKLGAEEDEHILANPELYGLRRSVRCPSICQSWNQLTIAYRADRLNTEPSYVVFPMLTAHHIATTYLTNL